MATDTTPIDKELDELLQLTGESSFALPQAMVGEREEAPLNELFMAAISSPVEGLPLSQSVFAGDSVTIVLQPEIPQAKSLLDIAIRALLDAEVESTDISVVIDERTAATLGLSTEELKFKEQDYPVVESFHSVQFVIHDLSDPQAVAYLAANQEGLPVMVSRPVFDADVVLPIGFPTPDLQHAGCVSRLDNSIYPAFSTDETRERFLENASPIELAGETRMANDHLGVLNSIQVVPGVGDSISHVLFGERNRVAEKAQSSFANAWRMSAVPSADLVVATIESQSLEQTWSDFSRALQVADELAPGEFPIVVWSAISRQPGTEMLRAFMAPFEDELESSKKMPQHLLAFSEILNRRGVFFHGGLGQQPVEKLGLGYVSNAADVSRMIADATHGLLVRDAHRCLIGGDR